MSKTLLNERGIAANACNWLGFGGVAATGLFGSARVAALGSRRTQAALIIKASYTERLYENRTHICGCGTGGG